MRVFVYAIGDDRDSPAQEAGYVRAETADEAIALIGHPDVTVYHLPADAEWPGRPDTAICPWPATPLARSAEAPESA